ncbi:MAG: hypothetical protein OXU19_19295, partial [bacterium]|nr:hypothetical protein [bacterium]
MTVVGVTNISIDAVSNAAAKASTMRHFSRLHVNLSNHVVRLETRLFARHLECAQRSRMSQVFSV